MEDIDEKQVLAESNGVAPSIATVSKEVDQQASGALQESLAYQAEKVHVYKIRWVILGLFVMYSMSNAFQWIQYAIISNIISDYYGVELVAVNWCSMIFMVSYIPLIFPATWFLDNYGLRKAVLIGSFGTMLGAWIKVGSLSPDRFWVTFIGQAIAAFSQIFILGIPPKLAAVWFGAKQVSSACAIGVFGNQMGIAIGFLLPPVIVPNSDNVDDVTAGLTVMFYGVAAVTTVLFVLVVLVFRDRPHLPPSLAQAAVRSAESENYTKSIVRLVRNRNYFLLLLTYGMNVGVFYAISTLLNQMVMQQFKDAEEDAGRIGLVLVVSGMLGSVVCGIWLDRTHRFKETTLAVYILSLVGMVAFTFTLGLGEIAVVYFMAGLLGFFMTGYLPLGFEFAAELTYPESEGTSSGMLNASAQVFGIILTMADGQLLDSYGDIAANLMLCASLLLGSILTSIIKADLRRQRVLHQPHFVVPSDTNFT